MENKKNGSGKEKIVMKILKWALIIAFWPVFAIIKIAKSKKMNNTAKTVGIISSVILGIAWYAVCSAISQGDKKPEQIPTVENSAPVTTITATTETAPVTTIVTTAKVTEPVTESPKITESVTEAEEVTEAVTEPEQTNPLIKASKGCKTYEKLKYYNIKCTSDELIGLTPKDFRDFSDSISKDATTLAVVLENGNGIHISPFFLGRVKYWGEYGSLSGDDYHINDTHCMVAWEGDTFEISIGEEKEDGTYDEIVVAEYETISQDMLDKMESLRYW